jgi:hypothetical protein
MGGDVIVVEAIKAIGGGIYYVIKSEAVLFVAILTALKYIPQGIVYWYKKRRGDLARDREEKNREKQQYHEMRNTILRIDKKISEINGSVGRHHNDTSIHTPAPNLVFFNDCKKQRDDLAKVLFNTSTKIDILIDGLDSKLNTIHQRIDDLYKRN